MLGEKVEPISHITLKHLNKKVTILGFYPILGGFLIVIGIFLPIFSVAMRIPGLIIVSVLYLIAFVPYTLKQMRNVKDKRLDVIDLLLAKSKVSKTYSDKNNIIEIILKDDK